MRQKGVDLIADVAGWLLSEHVDAQLILVGPIGDGFGHYAASKLQQLDENGQYQGRLYVNIQFMLLVSIHVAGTTTVTSVRAIKARS